MKILLAGAGIGILAMTLSGCGNADDTDVAGGVGLTRLPNGHLGAYVATCGKPITEFSIVSTRGDLKDSQTNAQLGLYKAANGASGPITIDLESGAPGWVTEQRYVPRPSVDDGLIASGFNTPKKFETEQISVPTTQFTALKPGQVLQSDGMETSHITTTTKDQFFKTICPQK